MGGLRVANQKSKKYRVNDKMKPNDIRKENTSFEYHPRTNSIPDSPARRIAPSPPAASVTRALFFVRAERMSALIESNPRARPATMWKSTGEGPWVKTLSRGLTEAVSVGNMTNRFVAIPSTY